MDDEIKLKVVPFKKEEVVEEKEEEPSPQEMFEHYMEKSEATDIIVCGYNEEGSISFITNMDNRPEMCYALDLVKLQIMKS